MFKKIFSIGFIILFLALSYNKVANWHIHIINGIPFQHAHANSDTSTHHHSHSKTELVVLNIINGLFWDQIQSEFLPNIIEKDIRPYFIKNVVLVCFSSKEFSNKSPPFLV